MTIKEYIDKNKNELFELLCDLVRINSESFSSYGNEEEVAKYVSSYFDKLNIENCMYSPDDIPGIQQHEEYLPGRGLENRYNVTARIPGNGRKLMLAGHSDTVLIGERSLWSFPPIDGIIKDGKIYGRGACDDKFALAVSMFIFKMIKELNLTPKCDLYFTAYSDEEYGGGNGTLAACLKYPCDMYLNLDGCENEIRICGIGGTRYMLTVEDSTVRADAAVLAEAIGPCLKAFDGFKKRRYEEINEVPCFRNTSVSDLSFRVNSVNTVDSKRFEMEITFFTVSSKEDIEAEMAEITEAINKKLSQTGLFVKSLERTTRFFKYASTFSDNAEAERLIKLSGGRAFTCGSGLSDLSLFMNCGNKRSLSFGAGRNFDREGGFHQPNEYIECDVLTRYCEIIANYALDFE